MAKLKQFEIEVQEIRSYYVTVEATSIEDIEDEVDLNVLIFDDNQVFDIERCFQNLNGAKEK
tara:strand:+ start:276 stop:461 length:186 start_codon:yes stop_codon:yes gene_type:complete